MVKYLNTEGAVFTPTNISKIRFSLAVALIFAGNTHSFGQNTGFAGKRVLAKMDPYSSIYKLFANGGVEMVLNYH